LLGELPRPEVGVHEPVDVLPEPEPEEEVPLDHRADSASAEDWRPSPRATARTDATTKEGRMDIVKTARKLRWRRKKAGWLTRFAGFLGRSRKLTLFAGLVALLG